MRVLVTTIPFAERDQTPLESLKTAGAEVVINPLGRKLTESDLANLISDFDIVIAGTEPITDKVLSRANRLKLIARVGIGLDSVDLIAARKREILVSYTPDAPSPAVAELTLGLMIDLLRSAHVSNLRMHQGIWYRYFGQRVARSSIGIIGLGRIGSAVIHHLSGFKCEKILVNDIDKTVLTPTHPHCKVERVDKNDIFRQADIISLHVPLTAKTINLISARQMDMMKPGVMLINTSRGGIINEKDLHDYVKSGRVGAAAVDVFEQEPYDGLLAKLDNCMLTAHMGSMSVDCRTQMAIESTAEAIRFITNQPLLSVVPESEYENQALSR